MMIPHNRPSITEADIQAVSESLNSRQLAPGPETTRFEKEVAARYGRDMACAAASSGTAALFLALYGLGVGPGDEVLVPTYACSALLNAVNMVRAAPVVVDIEPLSWNVDPKAASIKLTRKTRALIVTHTFGQPAAMAPLLALGVPVIEDCAQAIGAETPAGPVGICGQVATFSFYATKMITTGHGGMVASRDNSMMTRVRDYLNFDSREDYIPRFNLQMSDFQAALGRMQLQRLTSFVQRRRLLTANYQEALVHRISGWHQSAVPDAYANGYRCVALVSDAASRVARMERLGVKAAVPIERFELLHRYLKLNPADFPVAESLVARTLSLPVFPELTDEEVTRVISAASEVLL